MTTPAATVPLFDPSGTLRDVSPVDARAALQQGWTQATPEQVSAYERSEKFGTAGQGLATFAEGVGEGVLGPVVPAVERAFGVPAEDIRARAEENPISHGAGVATGIVGSIAAPLPKGLKAFTLPGVAEKAGMAAKAAAPASRFAPAMAQGAAEAAVFAGSDIAERAVVQDPKLTAEKVASELLIAPLFGAGLGAVSKLLPSSAKLADRLEEKADEAALRAFGITRQDVSRVQKAKGFDAPMEMARELRQKGIVGAGITADESLNRAEALIASGVDRATTMADAASQAGTEIRFGMNQFREEAESAIAKELSETVGGSRVAKAFKEYMDDFGQVYGGRDLSVNDLWKIRQDLDGIIYREGRAVDPWAKAVNEPLKKFRDTLSGAIEGGIEKSGGSAAAWREAMRDMELGFQARKWSQIGVERLTRGNLHLGPMEMLGSVAGAGISGAPGALAGMVGTRLARQYGPGVMASGFDVAAGILRGMADKTDLAIAKGIRSIFEAGEGKAAAEIAGKVIKPAEFSKVATDFRQRAGDLDMLAQNVSTQTGPIADHLPETTSALQGASARAMSHITDSIPTRQTQSPLDPPYQPSQAQLSAFSRRLEVAENPASVLHHIAAGTLAPEHLETLSVVYPALASDMRAQLMGKVAETIAGGKPIPYRVRLGLAMFLGGEMDSSMKPDAIAANQQAFAALTAKQQAKQASQQEAMARITVSNRTMTPAQSAAYRRT